MIESITDIATADGRMDTFVCHPEQGGPFPSVFVLMDIWGLREELFDIARKIAVTGYHCMVPNFWYRQGRVRFEFRDARDRMLSLDQIPDEAREAMRRQMALTSDEMAMADVKAALDFLAGRSCTRIGTTASADRGVNAFAQARTLLSPDAPDTAQRETPGLF